jgi:exodeoxyribonuclease VII small subunit
MEIPSTYEEAFRELQQISSEIDSETVSVDVLAEKVQRASFLIQYCQAKLKSTEEEVNNVIRQMETGK